MPVIQKIIPCLWFDSRAEEAVAFYTAIFKNSKVVTVSRYGEAGKVQAEVDHFWTKLSAGGTRMPSSAAG